jgi:hypothetical protein
MFDKFLGTGLELMLMLHMLDKLFAGRRVLLSNLHIRGQPDYCLTGFNSLWSVALC